MTNKKITVDLTDNYKLVVISDVHGHKAHLSGMLEELNLKDSDHLVILGDFLNRGFGSIETYKYIRKLEKRANTYIMKGNHESFMQRQMSPNNDTQEFFEFLKAKKYDTLISELVTHAGVPVDKLESPEQMYDLVGPLGLEIQAYLKTLPILMYFDDMILVHGGFDPDLCLETQETKFLKFDYYNKVAKPNDKLTIVGHWPVSELRETVLTNLPLHNEDKNIISIDGGLGGRPTGELNALIIEKRGGETRRSIRQFNTFEKRSVKHEYAFETEPLIYLNYENEDFEILSTEGQWSLCRHIARGIEFKVFTSLIDPIRAWKLNYVNNFLNLEVGEEVEVCGFYDLYALVKYEDSFGWLMKSQVI